MLDVLDNNQDHDLFLILLFPNRRHSVHLALLAIPHIFLESICISKNVDTLE